MTAQSPVPIQLHDQPHVFTIEDKQTLITVVDQLNIVTERLHKLEEQIANGTLIINQEPATHLRVADETSSSTAMGGTQTGWQPTRR